MTLTRLWQILVFLEVAAILYTATLIHNQPYIELRPTPAIAKCSTDLECELMFKE